MQANLSALKKQRARYAPKQANNSAKRNRIMASLRRNRCGRPGQEDTRIASNDQQPKSRRRTLLEQVFGVRAYDNAGNRRYDEIIGGDENLASRFGTFRTLCVRKTDGYYFPISFSTVSERFEEDALTCQSMCPGTDVGLYHHRMPHEDSEDMVSYATNTAYRDEPFAFAYRQIHNPDNRCRFSTAGITQNVDTTPLDEVEGTNKEVRIGTPVFRKDQTLSPDAFDTAVEGLTANAIENYFASVRDKKTGSSDDVLANNRKVRIVGPAFFPVQ
ncbi:MAG: DUF2865 domain-containing protein [Rhizobiaceae bacterium]|nr:DUF2865 domain-containing protein [Rhizobiaceae bacterium]